MRALYSVLINAAAADLGCYGASGLIGDAGGGGSSAASARAKALPSSDAVGGLGWGAVLWPEAAEPLRCLSIAEGGGMVLSSRVFPCPVWISPLSVCCAVLVDASGVRVGTEGGTLPVGGRSGPGPAGGTPPGRAASNPG